MRVRGRPWDGDDAMMSRAASVYATEAVAGTVARAGTGIGTGGPAEWAVGDRILGLYEITGVHGQGGMGVVYRVRHLGWDVELAAKRPRAEFFRDEDDRRRFVREVETWISFGMHPHVCVCHYVRTIDGIPTVFAEYLQGGSLRDWIDQGRLHKEGTAQGTARILDVAIQAAWGLRHAHDRGVVHQDVKPANLLLDASGNAKVADFGLARSGRPAAGGRRLDRAGRHRDGVTDAASIVATVDGMTPAYASPEQMSGRPLGRRTDVWSLAVSVLEMFTGGVTWAAGPVAAAALAQYRGDGEGIPASLAEVLERCLREDPAERPDMGALAADLIQVYEREVGVAYPRAAPRPVEHRADELNNRGLSVLDLGRVEEAEAAFGEALAIDSQHLEATYNLGLLRWRTGRLTDDVFVRQMMSACDNAADVRRARYLLAQVHLERGDRDSAVALLEEASRMAPGDDEIRAALDRARSAEGATVHKRAIPNPGGANFSVGISDDGRLAAAGPFPDPSGSRIVVWSPNTGRLLGEHHTPGDRFVLSGDGRRAVIGAFERVIVKDVATGRELNSFTPRLGGESQSQCSVASLHFTVDRTGRRALIWGLTSARVRARGAVTCAGTSLWDLTTGRRLTSLGRRSERQTVFRLSPDGEFAISADERGGAHLWSLRSGRRFRSLRGHADRVLNVALSADGRIAATASRDEIRVWDVGTGRCLRAVLDVMPSLQGSPAYFSVSQDGRFVLMSRVVLRLWEMRDGRCLRTFDDNYGGFPKFALSADGRNGIFANTSGDTFLWRFPRATTRCAFQPSRPRAHRELETFEARVEALVRDGERALAEGRFDAARAVLSEARSIPGYERNARILRNWRKTAESSTRAGVNGVWSSGEFPCREIVEGEPRDVDGHRTMFFIGEPWGWLGESGEVSALDVRMGIPRSRACLSGDGRLAMGFDREPAAWLWDVRGGRRLMDLDPPDGAGVLAGCLSPDGRLALTSTSKRGTVHLWHVATGRHLRTLEPPSAPSAGDIFSGNRSVTSLAFTPDARLAVTGDRGGTLRKWDLRSGRCLHTMKGHTDDETPGAIVLGRMTALAVSADGRLAVTAGGDATIRVWDLERGRFLHTLDGHRGQVGSVGLTADGRYAVSGGGDRTMRIWDLRAGRCVWTVEHIAPITVAALSADGDRVLTTDSPGTSRKPAGSVRLWEIDWNLDAQAVADWDEGARPYLDVFLTLRTPYAAPPPDDPEPSEERIVAALTRKGRPSWTDDDFEGLLHQLQAAGYGRLRPAGVKAELERMARDRAAT